LEIGQKAAHVAANYFSKAAHFAGRICSEAKTGVVQGFQTARVFVGTHQKETAIAGGVIVAGAAAIYVAHRIFAGFKKADTQSQAV
jgi:hypothetical protein